MKKSFRYLSLAMALIAVIFSLTGCALFENSEAEVAPYEESLSKDVKVASVKIGEINGEKLVITEGTKEITAEMLNGKTLISIDIPESVEYIEKEVISKDTIIICHDSTYAADFAAENGYWYYLTYETLDVNNKVVTLEALYTNENKMITEAMPCNSQGILYTLDGVQLKQDTQKLIGYIDTLVNNVKTGLNHQGDGDETAYMSKPYIGYTRDYAVDDIELTPVGTEDDSAVSALKSARKIIKDKILNGAKSDEFMPSPEDVNWGEDNSATFTIGTVPYSADYDKNETFSAYCIENADINEINVNFGDIATDELLNTVYSIIPAHDKAQINAEFDKLSDYLDVSDEYTVEYNNCRIKAVANRFTDEAETIELYRVSTVKATAKGVGAFEYLGQFEITFKFTDKLAIAFDWDKPAE